MLSDPGRRWAMLSDEMGNKVMNLATIIKTLLVVEFISFGWGGLGGRWKVMKTATNIVFKFVAEFISFVIE